MAFSESKLTADAQATLLQESFAHASQLALLCLFNEASLELTDLVMQTREEGFMSEELELRNRNITRAYVLLRVTLGLNICLHGAVRWLKGLHSFAELLVPLFAKTPLPPWIVFDFGYVLPVLEAVVGAAVLFGLQTRRALLAGSILMLVLMFGSSLREDWPTVGIQLTYSVVYCVLIAGVSFDALGIDHRKRSSL